MATVEQVAGTLASVVSSVANNHYKLTIEGLNLSTRLSVLSLDGHEALNQPWRYEITFTSTDKQIPIHAVLSQSASLTFEAPNFAKQLTKISSLEKPVQSRILYGVITEFSLLAVSKDEARYRVVLQPRLALCANDHYSAIYQNQSVVAVVEEVLRRHGFTGVDYRLELKDSYSAREFITQWQESDLEFIQRLLSDVGIWFRFESHSEHHCDVLVLSDYEQGLEDAGHIALKTPSGMVDGRQHSVWDLQFSSTTQPKEVITQDYNYRTAEVDQYSLINTVPNDSTTVGTDYLYGEHYKSKGDDLTVESGQWYAKIRHEAHLSQKLIIQGECNDFNLMPGQRIIINGSAIDGIHEGIIILSTQSHGDRSESYRCHFTAIPHDVLKPYRPQPLPWPQVAGTLPARVTSPDNDTYGYIDTQGRYRVKFDFDLKTWKNGEESLWVRLAKPYSGDTYGFHFPLIDGTGVAIAFTEGNPDRPYIAHALHDSTHPDHVATANKHRNVIRTPANNKLRMDDKRGQEHIKLATEYGKTQLNLGHLVNQNKEQRGEGFELRSDEWGAIRAGKGLLISADEQYKAQDTQLNMQQATEQLNKAISLVSSLQDAAKQAQAELADLERQKKLLVDSLDGLKEAAILLSSPKGIAQVTPNSIQLSAGENVIVSSHGQTDFNILRKFTLAAGEAISIFAQKLGIKLFASHGKVDIQAQNDEMSLSALKDILITSQQGRTVISAKQELILTCGGAYLRLANGSVEIGAPDNIINKSATWQKLDADSLSQMSNEQKSSHYVFNSQLRWQHNNAVVENQSVRIVRADNTEIVTMTDSDGRLPAQFSQFVEPIQIILDAKNKK
ncbi:type VI secretion system Vgr family protein [Orbus mooreae]|uniref:type VI secretion system Vgr family protein n=1 Tax=Orbus mooreae TaxID=3074107 RepID=UPI00370D14CD